MIKIASHAAIDATTQGKLDKYPVGTRPKRWEGKAKPVKTFKDKILEHGLLIQDHRCAWCTLEVGEKGRRTAHRDHIAPKNKFPAWTFFSKNIVVACEYCNGFSVKGEVSPIEVLHDEYEKCTFLIIHPYLDDPEIHIEFENTDDDAGVLVRAKDEKGRWTIENLKLDSIHATKLRAKDALFKKHAKALSPQDNQLVQNAMEALTG